MTKRSDDRNDQSQRGLCAALLHGLAMAALATTVQGAARAETVVVEARQDATLIESEDGGLANGSGPALFVGRNNASSNAVRRALLAFDVAAVVPDGAWVTAVALELEVTPSNHVPVALGLHRVLSPWSEGPSSASGGGGAAAEPGDATWLHATYDSVFWTDAGGDFEPIPSAVTSVGEPGRYVWSSTSALVADVQGWLDDPASSFGWILIGGEDTRQSARSLASRESPDVAARPRLLVDYETRCDAFDLAPGALGICRAYCEALACARPDRRGSPRACDALAARFARRTRGLRPPCGPPTIAGEGPAPIPSTEPPR